MRHRKIHRILDETFRACLVVQRSGELRIPDRDGNHRSECYGGKTPAAVSVDRESSDRLIDVTGDNDPVAGCHMQVTE